MFVYYNFLVKNK